MLKIHKSYFDNGYIVYDQHDFEKYHTHTKHLRTANMIRNNVNKLRLPKSQNKRMIESHIRVSRNSEYTDKLKLILKNLEEKKNAKDEVKLLDGKSA